MKIDVDELTIKFQNDVRDRLTEDWTWLIGTLTKEKSGLTYVELKVLFGTSLIGTFYGGLKVFLFMVHFDFGDDVGLVTVGVSYILPLMFMVPCGLIFIGLSKIWSDGSATAGNNVHVP